MSIGSVRKKSWAHPSGPAKHEDGSPDMETPREAKDRPRSARNQAQDQPSLWGQDE
jgi:hypothetical protein